MTYSINTLLGSFRSSDFLISLVLALVAGGLVGGCGALNSSSVSPKKLKRLDQVAVASIVGANQIKTDLGQDKSAGGGKVINSAEEAKETMGEGQKRAKPNFAPLMERSHEYVFGELQDVLPFGFIDEQKVLGSSAYQNYDAQELKGPVAAMVDKPEDVYVSAKDYRAAPPSILQRNAAKREELFNLLPSGTNAILAFDVTYHVGKAVAKEANQVENMEGDGQRPSRLQFEEGDRVDAQIQAEIKTQVMTRDGSIIMDVTQKEWSGDRFTFVYGEGWEAEEINDLAMTATEKALKSTTSYLKKQLSPAK